MSPTLQLEHENNCGIIKISTKNIKETNGKQISSSIKIQNVSWKLNVSETNGKLKYKLSCNETCANTMWNCLAEIDVRTRDSKLGIVKVNEEMSCQGTFNYNNRSIEGILCEESNNEQNESADTREYEVEVSLKMAKTSGYRKRKIINYSIEHPRFSNGIISIDDKKIHVNKQILGMHSKFFYNLFFGEFIEKKKRIFEIHNVPYNDFLIFLDFVHPTGRKIEEAFVENLMDLADAFLADQVMDYCEEFLIQTKTVDTVKKMILAHDHSLCNLMDHTLNSLKNMDAFLRLRKSESYPDMCEEIKSSLLERAYQLHKQTNP